MGAFERRASRRGLLARKYTSKNLERATIDLDPSDISRARRIGMTWRTGLSATIAEVLRRYEASLGVDLASDDLETCAYCGNVCPLDPRDE